MYGLPSTSQYLCTDTTGGLAAGFGILSDPNQHWERLNPFLADPERPRRDRLAVLGFVSLARPEHPLGIRLRAGLRNLARRGRQDGGRS
ncbi:MAG: hypothetical protein JW751_18935, partial [Polyangiaceae bacterium]|nr:hypothetical protein [Polyangiaceae bacterium]